MRSLDRRTVLKAGAVSLAMPSLNRIAYGKDGPLKIGFVLPGPKDDGGWSEAHVRGAQAVKAKFKDAVELMFVESILAEPDAERVMRDFAQQGAGLVFHCSVGEATYKVAQKFPNVIFEQCVGEKLAPNVGTYCLRTHDAWAVCGTIAGLMTKTGKIGCVTSFPVSTVMVSLNAFAIMARKVNPKVEVIPAFLSTFYDPAKESDAARAFIAQGADFVITHNDGPAVLQIDEQKGAYTFGLGRDMSRYAPKSHLTGIVYNWGVHYTETVQKVLEGTWKAADAWPGIAEGAVSLSAYNPAVPAEVIAKADEVSAAIIAGSLSPFDGPVKDNKSAVVVPAGSRLDGRALQTAKWFAEGIIS